MKRTSLSNLKSAPYQHMIQLDAQVNQMVQDAGIDEGFHHLLRLHGSRLNGCAFCVKLHLQDALKHGESIERITLSAVWQESQYFSEAEKAALALIEALTHIDQVPLLERSYAQAQSLWSAEALIALEWIGIVINAWNRIGIAGQLQAKP